MSRLAYIFEQLQQHSDASVDIAMAAALPTADEKACRLIVQALLARNATRAYNALVENYHRLPDDIRALLLAKVDDLYHALRHASADVTQPEATANAVHIIAQSNRVKLAHLLQDVLLHGSDENRDTAANTLLHFATQLQTASDADRQASNMDGHWAADATSAVIEAVRHYTRHNRQVILEAAIAVAPHAGANLHAILDDDRHPAVLPMQRLVQVANTSAIRRSLIIWLTCKPMRESALQGMLEAATHHRFDEVLHYAHLLTAPRFRDKLKGLRDPAMVRPGDNATMRYHTDAMRQVSIWAASLPIDDIRRARLLQEYVKLPDPAARLSVLRQLMTIADRNTNGITEAIIAEFCSDSEPPIARIALRHLLKKRWTGVPRLLLTLINSAHPRVREIASAQLSSLAFMRVWEAWPRLDPAQQLAAGRALIKLDPNFHRLVSEHLAERVRDIRLRALSMITTLNQGHLFEEALIALARHPDHVVASAAVRALGTAESQAVQAVLEESLHHANNRVRANAIEALETFSSQHHVHELLELAQSDECRPRANAIKALLGIRTDEAMHALGRMLHDPRPEHRISALWVVEHMGVIEFSRQVAELCVTEKNAEVKRRADEVVHKLIDSLRETTPRLENGPGASTADESTAIDNIASKLPQENQ